MPKKLRVLRRDIGATALFCILALVPWAHWLSDKINLQSMNAMPSWQHPLGTDVMGRDLLVRLGQAASKAVWPLWFAVTLASALGIALALLTLSSTEYRVPRSTWLALEGIAAVLASIPVTVTTFLWAAFFEQAGATSVITSLCLVFTARAFLHIKNLFRQDSKLAYWTAHEAMGGRTLKRLWRYGVSSSWAPDLLNGLSLNLRVAVTVEASLSYLGFGMQEPEASFGNILATHFDGYLKGHWWVLTMTILALAVTASAPQAAVRLISRLGLPPLVKSAREGTIARISERLNEQWRRSQTQSTQR